MRDFTRRILVATVSAGALACLAIDTAAAADVPPVPYGQPREYYPPPQQGYVYREAPVYPAPPPVYGYYDPPVVVPPPVYYGRPYYYGPRWYGPRVAHYGYYGRGWGHRRW